MKLNLTLLIAVLLFSCNSGKNQNFKLERKVYEDTYQELFSWLKELPDSNSINPQKLTEEDSLKYPFLYDQLMVWLESDPYLDNVYFGIIMMDSIYDADFFFQDSPYLSDASIYPESLVSDSIWSKLIKDFSSRELESIHLDEFGLTYLGNLKVFKQNDHARDKRITSEYLIAGWYIKFSRVSFSSDRTKAVFYAEDYETHGGVVFAELLDGKWHVVHYEINWVG